MVVAPGQEDSLVSGNHLVRKQMLAKQVSGDGDDPGAQVLP